MAVFEQAKLSNPYSSALLRYLAHFTRDLARSRLAIIAWLASVSWYSLIGALLIVVIIGSGMFMAEIEAETCQQAVKPGPQRIFDDHIVTSLYMAEVAAGPPPKTLWLPNLPLRVGQFCQARQSQDISEAVWSIASPPTLPAQEHRSAWRREAVQLLGRRLDATLEFSVAAPRSDFLFYSLASISSRPSGPGKHRAGRKLILRELMARGGSKTSPYGKADTRALKTEKPLNGSNVRRDR
ncbi:hypothetical protein RF11_12553 [Thelohanellus kitauei]|uniref:Uncharacterized protein n=1 Tax=Thelohanellus kitauei TaxID=669202 RepID=A0A0C2MYY5_THEKT|nr:hypothetical protein RF11_12553 [Thelohanellus kitauei]